MLSVRLYLKTGYNACNIPYSPYYLENLNHEYYDAPAVDLLQTKGYGELTVKWDALNHANTSTNRRFAPDDVDYIAISGNAGGDYMGAYHITNGKTYYIVTGVQRLSGDTFKFQIIEDFVTTMGGIGNIDFTDGIIVRETPATNSWDNEIIEDELLGCEFPLEYAFEWLLGGTNNLLSLVESTLDLYSTTGIKYKRIDDTTGGTPQSILIPYMDDAGTPSDFKIQYLNASGTTTTDPLENPNGSAIFGGASQTAKDNIAKARALGIENGILNQYGVPGGMVTFTDGAYTGNLMQSDPYATLAFLPQVIGPTYNVNWADEAQNNRTYYRIFQGENCRYGLISCIGEKIEYLPEDIRNPALNDTSPIIVRVVDPRPDGKPYYAPKWFKKRINDTLSNSVSGAKWAKVPLRMSDVSGLDILQQQFKNTSRTTQRQHAMQSALLKNATAGAELNLAYSALAGFGGLAGGAVANSAKAGMDIYGGNFGAAAGDIANTAGGLAGYMKNIITAQGLYNSADIAQAGYEGVYQFNRQAELYNFGVQTETRAPEVFFPADTNTMRDLHNNGVMVYHYYPSYYDIKRHTTILNMYGIKCYKPISDIQTTNGRNYYYVEIRGAQVDKQKNSVSDYAVTNAIWERDGASRQLSAGVRSWRTKVNTADYTAQLINV